MKKIVLEMCEAPLVKGHPAFFIPDQSRGGRVAGTGANLEFMSTVSNFTARAAMAAASLWPFTICRAFT